MKSSRGIAWLGVVVGFAMVTAASAQMPGGGNARTGGAGAKGGGSQAMRPGDAPRTAGPSIADLVNLRMSQLEEDLNLQPGQRAPWEKYRDRVMSMLDDSRRAAVLSASAPAETTAPKRLDALADAARNRLTAIEAIVDAGKALYAVLTPEQRTLADRRLALPLATLAGTDAGSELRLRAMQRPPPGDAPPGAGPR